jgi:hypothetical protein
MRARQRRELSLPRMSFRSWTKPFSWVFPVKDCVVVDRAVVDYALVQSKNETARQNGLDFLWVK